MILQRLCDETMHIESIIQVVQSLTVRGDRDTDIQGIAYDSRRVRDRYLFVALPGAHRRGRDFIDDALSRGAAAIVSEDAMRYVPGVTHIRVEDARRALAEIACAFYGNPAARLEVFGITGTNGKTTTSYMVRDILRAAGRAPGLIGTVAYEIGARSIPADRTTPEAADLQAMLARMLEADCRSVAMEVSSHALAQKRVWGIDFDVGVFTNLTRDHLDYHGTMEAYFAAKTLLFRGLGQMSKPSTAVVNLDDPWGQQLANIGGGWSACVTYGMHPGATVRATDVELDAAGSRFTIESPWGRAAVRLGVLGRFNVSNALAAVAACAARGIEPAVSAGVLSAFHAAPGRLEPVPNERGLRVFVDYAHTDDALANVLDTLRELGPRRLLLVFGCGGDRDRTKRPLMGAVAAERADLTILTSDNPRSEDPAAIIEEIASGFGGGRRMERVLEREQAIARVLELAAPEDIVLIAGKGHENYQEFAHTVIPFDDREVVRRLLGG